MTSRTRWALVAVALIILVGAAAAAYFRWLRPGLPEPGTPLYGEYLRAFQVGVAALDTDRKDLARQRLDRAIELVPAEPAAWADRGLVYLRDNDLGKAAGDLKRASSLAPESGEIEALLGHLAERQGKQTEAVGHFRQAVARDPRDVMSLYALAEAVTREAAAGSEAEYQRLMEKILEVQPNNLHVLMQRARVAYESHDQAAFRDTLARLDRLSAAWRKAGSRQQLADVHKALEAKAGVPTALARLDNVLKAEVGYARDAATLKSSAGLVGTPVQHFLRLARPRPTPAPPDHELRFTDASWLAFRAEEASPAWDVLRLGWDIDRGRYPQVKQIATAGGLESPLATAFKAMAFVANGRAVAVLRPDAPRNPEEGGPSMPFPGGPKEEAPSAAGVLPFDWDNDLRMDLLLAGAGGLRFHHHNADGSFTDVTTKTGLADDIVKGDYYGAWAADVDMDGDLDVVLARRRGTPLYLRNNGDGTFKAIEVKEWTAVRDVRAFAWVDLDNDGAPDAAFLDGSGKVHLFANEHFAQFTPWPLPAGLGTFLAITAADVNDDGVFDLVALRGDGTILRISDEEHRKAWQTGELTSGAGVQGMTPGAAALFAADLDNNGALDLIVAGPRQAEVYLADEAFRYARLPVAAPLRAAALLDIDEDGRLDLVGLSAEGRPWRATVTGGRNKYRSQVLRPIANPQATGDNRNNAFAIGGDVEVRAGALVQKQLIAGPMVHFGLGEQDSVNVARITWPSGSVQWEFEVPDQRVLIAAQRLTGSCPFLFTYDGAGMRFAGDFMWGTPLGMFINGQAVSSFAQTTEWLKIRGEHLVPRDGYYDIRAQANLWETDYFDRLGLVVVDHPPDTEIHVDERFFLTPTPPELHVTTPARPVARAWDHHGDDVTELVRAIDGRYVDRAGRGKYQGVTADHWVEADLGDDAPAEGPIFLVARGWLHPTDSSINVALTQGRHDPPRPLVLEVPDGKGGWKVGRPALGFPAGKDKTMLIRLDGIDGPGVSRRFRLRTNMEIFWDYLGYARRLDPSLARLQRPEPVSAELRYRGILEMTQKDASSPELPVYDKVVSKAQPWRDLTGYYTRFGDVRELLAKVDDRYVIANAGDEIALRYPVPADPPPGWKRDFIWESDGWTRDGNPNTRHGKTVLPLPAHDGKGSDGPAGELTDDPVYRRYPQDWMTYHTRYVTPLLFEKGLRPLRRPGVSP